MNARAHYLVAFLIVLLSVSAFSNSNVPVTVDELNTSYSDKAPFLSFDGKTLYFSRQDGPGWHYTRLYEAARTKPYGPFSSIRELSIFNLKSNHVGYPWVSPDNLRMYYEIIPGKIMMTERASPNAPWLPGFGIVELNSIDRVAQPTLTSDELEIYFTVLDHKDVSDIWTANRPNRNSPFTDIKKLETNSPLSECQSSISSDGLTLYFMSDRNHESKSEVFKAARDSREVPFDEVEPVSGLDIPGYSFSYPTPDIDNKTLYLCGKLNNSSLDILVFSLSEK